MAAMFSSSGIFSERFSHSQNPHCFSRLRRVQPARARPLFQSRLCRRKRRWKDRSEGGKRKECRVSPQFPRCGFHRRCCGGCRSQGIQNRTCSPRCREPEHSSSLAMRTAFSHDHGNQFLGRGYHDDALTGMDWNTVSGTSPVPGGMSTNMKSTSDQITSVQNWLTAPAITGPRQSTGSVSLSSRRLMDMRSTPRADYCRKKAVFVGIGLPVYAERLRNGRAGDVRIQNGGMISLLLHGRGQQRGDERFSDAALAAYHGDYIFDGGKLMGLLQHAFRISVRTGFMTGFTVVGTVFAHFSSDSFLVLR